MPMLCALCCIIMYIRVDGQLMLHAFVDVYPELFLVVGSEHIVGGQPLEHGAVDCLEDPECNGRSTNFICG